MLDKLENIKQYDNSKVLKISASILILLFLAIGSFTYSQIEVTTQKTHFETNGTVLNPDEANSTRLGIATGQNLSFGKFDARFNKTKSLNLSSNELVYVQLSSTGNISDKLHYDKKHLFEGKREIEIKMAANEYGHYDGVINVDMKIAQNKWGEKWLELLYNYS